MVPRIRNSESLLLSYSSPGSSPCIYLCVSFLFCFVLFLLFKATSTAYGDFQARGRIRATAAGLHHCSWQCQILNPVSMEARDQTRVLMDTSRFVAAEPNGNSHSIFFRGTCCLGLTELISLIGGCNQQFHKHWAG